MHHHKHIPSITFIFKQIFIFATGNNTINQEKITTYVCLSVYLYSLGKLSPATKSKLTSSNQPVSSSSSRGVYADVNGHGIFQSELASRLVRFGSKITLHLVPSFSSPGDSVLSVKQDKCKTYIASDQYLAYINSV